MIVSMISSAVRNRAPASLVVTTAGVDVALEVLAEDEEAVCEAEFKFVVTVVEPDETVSVAVAVLSGSDVSGEDEGISDVSDEDEAADNDDDSGADVVLGAAADSDVTTVLVNVAGELLALSELAALAGTTTPPCTTFNS